MKRILLILSVILINTVYLSAQLTATATPSPALCPSNGSIVVNASGGVTPYQYSVFGPVTKTGQSSNIFHNLTPGTYTVEVRDKTGEEFTIQNVIITTTYRKMFATANAVPETCGGSNTGSITMSLRTSQNDVGTPPYVYRIVSAPAGQPLTVSPSTSNTSYTFSNLIPGNYRVSVTDACNQTQASDVILNAGPMHTSSMKSFPAISTDCGTTDYYLQPQLGSYFPHTYHAYLNGDLTSTPTTFTFTSGTQMVTVPGTTAKAFKVTLPTPSPFNGGIYTFKYTDFCNTDVNSPRVQPITVTLGDFQVNTSVANCKRLINVTVGNGWKFPVTATAVPVGGGAALTGTISDPSVTRIISIEGAQSGKTYTVSLEDGCSSHTAPPKNVVIPDLASTLTINIYQEGGGTIDGVKSLTLATGSGWQKPVTATLISGPASYFSTMLNQTITATYPITTTQGTDDYVRFRNLIPGTYVVRITDNCMSTKDFTITITNNNLQSFNFPPLTWTGCPGSQRVFSTASSAYGGIVANLYRTANNSIVSAGQGGTFNFPVNYGDYYVTYQMSKFSAEVFVNPNNNGTIVNLKRLDVNVPFLSAYPEIGDYGLSQCSGSSTIWVALYKSTASADISTFSIEKTSGQGDFYTPQSSNLFELNDYGEHRYRVTDACGNVNEGILEIEPNSKPIFGSDKCLTAENITLSTRQRRNTTYSWIKPDGTIVDGNKLMLGTRTAVETYKLIATYTVGSCTEKDTTIFTLPLASVVLSDTVVHQRPYTFTVPISGIETGMSWYKNDVLISGETTNSLEITAPGTYKFVAQYSQSGCQSTTTRVFSFPNYWMGGNGASIVEKENWADPLNWTNHQVPLANQSNPSQNEDIIFATIANFNEDAVNDLVLDVDRTVGNVTNESPVALRIPTDKTLIIGGIASTGTADQLILKSEINKANGALVFTNPSVNANVKATVEFASKSKPATGTWPRSWQYFGVPVSNATLSSLFNGETNVVGYLGDGTTNILVRKYDESLNLPGNPQEKWTSIGAGDAIIPFHGYEITQPANAPTHSVKGSLNTVDKQFTFNFTSGVYFRGNYVMANSYAAPIWIEKMVPADFGNLEQTVYLYNSGSRQEWIDQGYGTANGSNPGEYNTVPINTASTLGIYQIPPMQGFVVRRLSNAQGYVSANPIQLNIRYETLYRPAGNTKPNQPQRVKSADNQPISLSNSNSTYPLLTVDVKSAKSADRLNLLTVPTATKGFDNGWDGQKFQSPNDAQIYVLTPTGERFQVSSDADLDGTTLGFYNGSKEGDFSMSFRLKEMENVYDLLEIVDLQTGRKQEITDEGIFRFTVNSLSPEARFKINTVKNNSVNSDQVLSITTNIQSKNVIVNNTGNEAGTVKITDISGKLMLEAEFESGISAHSYNLAPGIYVVNATTKSNKTALKIVVR